MANSGVNITRSGSSIFIHLPGKEYKSKRLFGKEDGNTLHVYREEPKHFMRVFQGYGVCYEAIKKIDFKYLAVHTPRDIIYTSKEFLLSHGKFLHLQKNKLDKQIFLPESMFGLERARQWEREQKKKGLQGDFFA